MLVFYKKIYNGIPRLNIYIYILQMYNKGLKEKREQEIKNNDRLI